MGRLDQESSPMGWDCFAVQEQEDRAVEAFKTVNPAAGDFQNACKHLNGYQIWMADAGSWISDYGNGSVAGETHCDLKYTTIGLTAVPNMGALSHEMAHMVQDCVPADHTGWWDAGIYDAIEKADEP